MQEIIHPEPARVPAVPASPTPADMVLYVMQQGGSIDQLEKFYALQQRYEADQARKAYVDDMAQFKLNPPTITKDKHVSFKTNSGKTEYDHATIGNVTNSIIGALAKHGFSHSWKTEQRDGQVIVTCTITHRLGHSESFTLQAAPDASGGKNSIQSIVSAQTYLQRHTLLAATGLATHDQVDDDGRAALDTSLADKWIAEVKKVATVEDLDKVWAGAIKEIKAVDDRHAYSEVKQACVARKAEIEGGAQ
jgi:hypothetical protein